MSDMDNLLLTVEERSVLWGNLVDSRAWLEDDTAKTVHIDNWATELCKWQILKVLSRIPMRRD